MQGWLFGLAISLVIIWVLLVCTLLVARPPETSLKDLVRVMPDLLRMLSRVARDPELPRGSRIAVWVLLGYLALPIDLIPDFIPLIGFADDAIAVIVVLRYLGHGEGAEVMARHWPGTEPGLQAVRRLAGAADR